MAVGLCAALGSVAGEAAAQTQREPVVVVGLRPASGGLDGPADIRRLSEAQELRRITESLIRRIARRPILGHAGLRSVLGVEYLVDFVGCAGKVACVGRLIARLKSSASMGIYGEYTVRRRRYEFRIRLMDVARARIVNEVEFTLAEGDVKDRKLWRRELEPLFEGATIEPVAEKPPEKPGGEDSGVPELPPISTDGGTAGDGTAGDGTEELPAIDSSAEAGATESAAGGSEEVFIDDSLLDAGSRGVIWHGFFQNYTALGSRGDFESDLLIFDDLLQLEFESDINLVRVIGKPQLLLNVLDGDIDIQFREMYAARNFKRVDLTVGEQVVTWGITDFWPVVDIINPRNFSQFKNWRPIDEKLPVPALQSTGIVGPLTISVIGVPLLGRSTFQLDQESAFALPIPAPPGAGIEQEESPLSLENAGGGARVDVAISSWKLSAYALLGRDPLPAIYAETDPATMATTFVVANDRVAMGAASVQGNIDALGAILKAEGAGYLRIDDECEGREGDLGGIPECFYLRRVPTARANVALERRILPGLDAHLQFISEITVADEIPRLPPAIVAAAPGIPEQNEWNRIFTLRLQGDWVRGNFRPMAFIYWSLDDEDFFANADLEYHVADGFALGLGVFWFQGYASDENKNQFTIAGSLESSSNGYLRATAWF